MLDDRLKQTTQILALSPDDVEGAGKMVERQKKEQGGPPNFPLLADPDHRVMTAYGAYGEKMMYGVKKVGVIRSTVWIGPDGRVRHHWARVANAERHPEQVLTTLRDGI